MNKKIIFPKRIPEPKMMEKLEFEVFEKFSLESYKRWFIPIADDALKDISLGDNVKIADIAGGPGFLAKELALRSKNFEIYSSDISVHAMKLARKNCKDFKNITLVIAPVEKLPFPDNFFDVVICKDSFHHFNNPKSALKEMLRVTKSEGRVYIQDLRRDLPQYLLQRAVPPNTVFKKLQYYSVRASYTKEEIMELCKILGVKKYSIRTRKLSHSLVLYYKNIEIDPEELKESFQSRYVALLQKNI